MGAYVFDHHVTMAAYVYDHHITMGAYVLWSSYHLGRLCLMIIISPWAPMSMIIWIFFSVIIGVFIQNNMGLETKILSLSILDAE